MKKDIITAASREDGADALKQWLTMFPFRHIIGMMAFDNKDGSVDIHILYVEEHNENGKDDNEL